MATLLLVLDLPLLLAERAGALVLVQDLALLSVEQTPDLVVLLALLLAERAQVLLLALGLVLDSPPVLDAYSLSQPLSGMLYSMRHALYRFTRYRFDCYFGNRMYSCD
ncbi:hypothetical protein BBJ29_000572 [Phytophthora kernoviae]|uniref:Secreted protein n=1 Tax=Phytophthora kernoviae TaxID=325452 RepID=A0A3F2S1S1_9STRA|nr:hypothetical protein BBJ29_000572 [Phytophthora kernoviae]RLN68662.1 hypothetical protein BBP00_00000909 [Phytophthora kernoviae]